MWKTNKMFAMAFYDDTNFETVKLNSATWTNYNLLSGFFSSWDAINNNFTGQAGRVFITSIKLNLQISKNQTSTSPRDFLRVLILEPKDSNLYASAFADILPTPATRTILPSDFRKVHMDREVYLGDPIPAGGGQQYQPYFKGNFFIRRKIRINRWINMETTNTLGVNNIIGMNNSIYMAYAGAQANEYGIYGSIRIYYVKN